MDKNLLYSIGNHPWIKKKPIDSLKVIINQNSQIIAIGECGIDKIKSPYSTDDQIINLKEQINLSEQSKLPLILHIVKGFNEIIKLKKELHPKQQWIIHGFNNYKQLDALLKSGFYLSFGKSLLSNINLQNSFLISPLNKVFLETDDSELEIEKLYNFAASIKKVEKQQLIEHIRENLKIITNGKLVRTT
tara:strand:+ start:638 stop:1207 length:570 start_codon:yes stop_codon:yes gene_type:complete